MHNQEKVFTQRQGEYEYQINALTIDLEQSRLETREARGMLEKAQTDISALERARDSFKTQFMEIKEINKELKT
jgi:hypothetical protein